jgi:hypothetical protein
MVTVLFPSPRGVGVILTVGGTEEITFVIFPRQPRQNQPKTS